MVDKRWFIGTASPAAAGLMMSFVWAFADGTLGWDGNELRYVALGVTTVAALLMVSRIRFWSFKGSGEKGPRADRVPFGVGAGADRHCHHGHRPAARAVRGGRDLCAVRPGQLAVAAHPQDSRKPGA